ncbi:Dbl homology domain-containing protein [Circinella umbellata]|nr:Dbl homology domain-containing protein [Circinella umbellata]
MAPKAPYPLQGYEQTLRELGYKNNWKLVKNELPKVQEHRTPKSATTDEQLSELYRALLDNTKRPLSQNVDVIIPGVQDRYQLNQTRYKQFLDVLGEPCTPQDPSFLATVAAKTESECLAEIENIEYSVNEEKRNDHILELIHTESTYVRLLQAIIELIARPLNPETLQYNGEQPIINRFKHKKLFSNMEEILENSQRFMFDLEKCIPEKSAAQQEGVCFGEVCASHIANFECYRYYVLNRTLADNVHATAYKENNSYKRFLDGCYRNQRFAQKEMGELLCEPVQRISRYTMMLKGILKYTSPNHRDYNPLVRAYIKACSIASMADDDPTKLATTCHTIQRSVKNSPCNLTNQNRSFIAHVDVDEIHRVKGKAKRPVTMFLFADKLMIAERPNYSCKGIDLCGDNGKIQESNGPIMWNHLKRDPMLKFKGWIDIEQVQIFEGAPGNPSLSTFHL